MFINSYKRRRKRKNTFSIHVLWICSVHLTPQNTLKKKGWQPATQCSAQKPILVVSALVHGQEFSEFIWIEFYLTSFSFSFSFQDPLSLTCQNHQSNRLVFHISLLYEWPTWSQGNCRLRESNVYQVIPILGLIKKKGSANNNFILR